MNPFNEIVANRIEGGFLEYLHEGISDGVYEALTDSFTRKMFVEALKQSSIAPSLDSLGKARWECAGVEMESVEQVSFRRADEGVNLLVPLQINDVEFRMYALNCGRDSEENAQGYVEGSHTYKVNHFIIERLTDRSSIFGWEDSAYSAIASTDMPKPLSSISESHEVIGSFLAWAAQGLASAFNEFGRQGVRENPRETYEVIQEQWQKMTESIEKYSE